MTIVARRMRQSGEEISLCEPYVLAEIEHVVGFGEEVGHEGIIYSREVTMFE